MTFGAAFNLDEQPAQRAGGASVCDATRTVTAGGAFTTQLLSKDFTPFERNYRVLPEAGLMTASQSRPIQFTLGSFLVPPTMVLALGEYRFRPYRFEGLIPGEAVPFEDYRLSLAVGNDMTVQGQNRLGNLRMQILPALPTAVNPATQPFQTGGTLMMPATAVPSVTGPLEYPFTALQVPSLQQGPALAPNPFQNATQFVTTLSGASLVPQRPDGQLGPSKLPFTYFVPENSTAVMTVVIFAPIRTPVAFFEGVLSGYLVAQNAMKAMMDKVRPCTGQ